MPAGCRDGLCVDVGNDTPQGEDTNSSSTLLFKSQVDVDNSGTKADPCAHSIDFR